MQPVDINMLQSFIDSSIIHPVRMVPCECPWARRGDGVKHLSVFGRQFDQAPGEEVSFEEQVP